LIGTSGGKGSDSGKLPQAARLPKIQAIIQVRRSCVMSLLLLEALGALVLLVLIVWWTMFSGRDKGELPGQHNTGQVPGDDPGKERDNDGDAPKN
jgi:hypothetical protein